MCLAYPLEEKVFQKPLMLCLASCVHPSINGILLPWHMSLLSTPTHWTASSSKSKLLDWIYPMQNPNQSHKHSNTNQKSMARALIMKVECVLIEQLSLRDIKPWGKEEEDNPAAIERVKWTICKPHLGPGSAQPCNTSIELWVKMLSCCLCHCLLIRTTNCQQPTHCSCHLPWGNTCVILEILSSPHPNSLIWTTTISDDKGSS